MFGFVNQKKLVERAVWCGIGEALFIAFTALFFFASSRLFESRSGGTIFGVAAVLILLVIGVAVSALLVFGYPLHYFFQRKYREALLFAVTVLGTLSLILAFILLSGAIIF